ncbi:ComEC/Rec2 family competence protein [Bacteroides propionicifaciens]|uniref:ComEC/Rec2 family competence protein n=1 Tax=Bacteroides propionicifaciens TaxID=392838 RepID=UPI00138AD506|nr:ComEC/Rec2 family competence protein [Bacteroides propionicifaciens]
MILSLFFKLVARWFGFRDSLALVLTVILLWLFALFVGGNPSVVRSVLLYTLLGLSTLSLRRRVGLNSLAFVAFVMLLFNPFWLFDIGFILSFSAVLAILMFYPLVYSLLKPRYILTRYLWGLIVVSLAAQLGTLPWIIYYFESFPIYFLLANILVIPMITILLYFLVVYVAMLWIPYLAEFLTSLTRWLTSLINDIVMFVGNLPYAKLTDICLYPVELGLLFLLILAFYCYSNSVELAICFYF